MVVGQRILITGANGFLASAIRAEFLSRENQITYLTRSPVRFALFENEQAIVCDLSDKNIVLEKLSGHSFDIIFHCASRQPKKNATSKEYFEGNVFTLENLLSALLIQPSTRFIHFSSAVVYGNVRNTILDESSPTQPSNEYALSKLTSEHILRMYAEQHSFSAFCLRLPSLHGRGQKGGLIHTYVEAILGNKPLEIYSQGELLRNVMSFDQVAAACKKLLQFNKPAGFYLYQLGSADALPMKKIAEYIAEKLCSESLISCVDTSSPNETDWIFNIKKARKEINFKPVSLFSSIDTYLAKEYRFAG